MFLKRVERKLKLCSTNDYRSDSVEKIMLDDSLSSQEKQDQIDAFLQDQAHQSFLNGAMRRGLVTDLDIHVLASVDISLIRSLCENHTITCYRCNVCVFCTVPHTCCCGNCGPGCNHDHECLDKVCFQMGELNHNLKPGVEYARVENEDMHSFFLPANFFQQPGVSILPSDQKNRTELLNLRDKLASIAALVCPLHAYWDIIWDINAYLKGEPTVLKLTTIDEWISYAKDLLSKGV